MRLISSFRDYYDTALAYGFDPKVVYVRETAEVERPAHGFYSRDFPQYFGMIGFCGKLYPFIGIKRKDDTLWTICWFIEDLDRFAKNVLNKKEMEKYKTEKMLWLWAGPFTYNRYPALLWLDKREQKLAGRREVTNNDCYYLSFFEKYRTPIFVHTYDKTIINANLRPWEFYRIKDAFTAFQELSMYVGNVLVQPVIEAPPLSDKDAAAIKGFDKYSFRKDAERERS